ncbi:MAG: DUF2892 domain-containing protein [Syntrophomonadaceae bacterium]|nr:DUF2892 domain-containing protein [Syntrophomonadaceae bacterium]
MNLSFERNLGTTDRVIRIIAGVILLFAAMFYIPVLGSTWGLLLGFFGLIMLVEGLVGY